MQDQLTIKSHLDTQIKRLLTKYSADDYILLDRGDGAAVCFLVEPEAALYFALDVREAVRVQENNAVLYEIRIGINLGPVKIILDVNGDKTTLGEGINCAARVMDFAGAGQIYVSRSFYDVVGCLGQEYAVLFSYLGTRADKHVRQFEIYEVAPAQSKVEIPKPGLAAAEPAAPCIEWDRDELHGRILRLTDELGPMAAILVQQAAQKASTLEELDTILAQPRVEIESERRRGPGRRGAVDGEFLDKAEGALAIHIGPIAALLVKQAAARTSNRGALLDLLAESLDADREKDAFLDKMDS